MPNVLIKNLNICDYAATLAAMQTFTDSRDASTPDEIWCLQHRPVYTQGQAGKAEHLLNPGEIPVVQSDRGGQITYHGPGQSIIYLLLDLKRLGIHIKALVCSIEQAVIASLNDWGIAGHCIDKAPGVYVAGAKICALGLRVRRGCSYHGLALNIDMDLSPFAHIHPCGFPDLKVTQVKDCIKNGQNITLESIHHQCLNHLLLKLGYTQQNQIDRAFPVSHE